MIKKYISFIITLIFVSMAFLVGCESKTEISIENTKSTIENEHENIESKLNKFMKNYCIQNEFTGSILVAKGNDVLLNTGYGMADYDNQIPNKSQTVFQIGSITKQFTAMAILMLQEKGLLSIEDTIDKYIADYPEGDKIKIYNLLTHTSGIPEYLEIVESIEKRNYTYTPMEIIEIFKDKSYDFNVGTRFEYSNSNYILLGYIIEKVSGMKYENYLEKNIFKPLELDNTGFINNQNLTKNKAIGYSNILPETGEYIKSMEIESSLPYSAGNIYSNVEDLYKWSNALYTEKLIKEKTLDKMFTPYLNNYGFGWFIDENNDGSKTVFHGGSIPGYISYISRNISKKYTVIILSNINEDDYGHDIESMNSELLKILDMED